MRSLSLAFFLAFQLCLAAPAFCAIAGPLSSPPAPPLGNELQPSPSWSSLTPAEKAALAPLAKSFDSLDAQQRRKWRAFAPRFERMTPKERQNAQSKMEKWAQMTPEQRLAARAQALKDRDSQLKSRQGYWSKWQGLSEGERAALGDQAAKTRR